eukprot:403365391
MKNVFSIINLLNLLNTPPGRRAIRSPRRSASMQPQQSSDYIEPDLPDSKTKIRKDLRAKSLIVSAATRLLQHIAEENPKLCVSEINGNSKILHKNAVKVSNELDLSFRDSLPSGPFLQPRVQSSSQRQVTVPHGESQSQMGSRGHPGSGAHNEPQISVTDVASTVQVQNPPQLQNVSQQLQHQHLPQQQPLIQQQVPQNDPLAVPQASPFVADVSEISGLTHGLNDPNLDVMDFALGNISQEMSSVSDASFAGPHGTFPLPLDMTFGQQSNEPSMIMENAQTFADKIIHANREKAQMAQAFGNLNLQATSDPLGRPAPVAQTLLDTTHVPVQPNPKPHNQASSTSTSQQSSKKRKYKELTEETKEDYVEYSQKRFHKNS